MRANRVDLHSSKLFLGMGGDQGGGEKEVREPLQEPFRSAGFIACKMVTAAIQHSLLLGLGVGRKYARHGESALISLPLRKTFQNASARTRRMRVRRNE